MCCKLSLILLRTGKLKETLMSLTNRLLSSTASATGKAVGGLARWAATDHINRGRPIQLIPAKNFIGAIGYFFMELIFGILGVVLTGAISYVLIAYGIPFFFYLMFEY